MSKSILDYPDGSLGRCTSNPAPLSGTICTNVCSDVYAVRFTSIRAAEV